MLPRYSSPKLGKKEERSQQICVHVITIYQRTEHRPDELKILILHSSLLSLFIFPSILYIPFVSQDIPRDFDAYPLLPTRCQVQFSFVSLRLCSSHPTQLIEVKFFLDCPPRFFLSPFFKASVLNTKTRTIRTIHATSTTNPHHRHLVTSDHARMRRERDKLFRQVSNRILLSPSVIEKRRIPQPTTTLSHDHDNNVHEPIHSTLRLPTRLGYPLLPSRK